MLMKILSLFHLKYLSALTTLQARSNPMPRQPLNMSLFHVNWCTEIAGAEGILTMAGPNTIQIPIRLIFTSVSAFE